MPTKRTLEFGMDVFNATNESAREKKVGVKVGPGDAKEFARDRAALIDDRRAQAPACFASRKSRTGHQVQFGFQYSLRR